MVSKRFWKLGALAAVLYLEGLTGGEGSRLAKMTAVKRAGVQKSEVSQNITHLILSHPRDFVIVDDELLVFVVSARVKGSECWAEEDPVQRRTWEPRRTGLLPGYIAGTPS